MRIKNPKHKALFKTITWGVFASVVGIILVMVFFWDDPNVKSKAFSIVGIEILIIILFYYAHEMAWYNHTKEIPDSSPPIFINKERRDIMTQRRVEFIKKYKRDIQEAAKENNHMTPDGKALVKKAREEIGYSSNTAACDIYRTLVMSL